MEPFLISLPNFQPGGMKLSLFIVLFENKCGWNGTQGKHTYVSEKANMNGLENMTSGAKRKYFKLPSLKEGWFFFFELWAVVLLGLTARGFKGWRDVSGPAALAGTSSVCLQWNLPVMTVAPAQDLCEPLPMAVASAEEQVLAPRVSPATLLSLLCPCSCDFCRRLHQKVCSMSPWAHWQSSAAKLQVTTKGMGCCPSLIPAINSVL